MAKKAPVSKAAQALKINKTSTKEKKKWTKGKTKDVVSRAVHIDQPIINKIVKEAGNASILTKTHLIEKYNLNGGVAKRILDWLCENGRIRVVSECSILKVYGKVGKREEVAEIITE